MTRSLSFELGDDAPKRNRSEDRLDHAGFARRVARVIASVDAADGYVLGLHGAWGSGKVHDHELRSRVRGGEQPQRGSVRSGRGRRVPALADHRTPGSNRGLPSRPVREAGRGGRGIPVAAAGRESEGLDHEGGGQGLDRGDRQGLPPVWHRAAWVTSPRRGLNAAVSALSSPSLQAAHRSMIERLRELDRRVLVTIDDIDRLEAGENQNGDADGEEPRQAT